MNLFLRSLALAMLLLVVPAPRAFGHALYLRSDPASGGQLVSPGQIQVWFTEDVEPSFSKIEVLDGNRRRVDSADTHPVPGDPRALVVSVGTVPDGTYTVSWQALSAIDGHVTRGVFPLVVGGGGISGALEDAQAFVPSARDVAARWIGYLAALALLGGFIFRSAVLAPALHAASTLPHDLIEAFDRRARRGALWAGFALVAATFFGMLSQAANAADVSLGGALGWPLLQLLGTRLGLLWEARLTLGLLLLLLAWRGRGRVLGWGGPALGGAVLATISLNSHAAAVSRGAWLAAALDWLHQIAAAAWVGGLFAFALLVAPILRPLKPIVRTAVLAEIVPRFSKLAIVAVIILGLTGLFHSWLQVTTIPALGTLYGVSLLVKLALIVPMLLLGGANLWLARPRLVSAAAGRRSTLGADVAPLIRRLRWAVAAEAMLGVGVLLATAVLAASEPARETYARQPRPIDLTGEIEDVNTSLNINPGRPGVNTFVMRLDDGTGQPPADVQRVILRFTYLDQDLGSGNLVLARRDDGSYGAVAGNLSTEGTWQVEPILRRRGREDARTGFRLSMASTETAAQAPWLDSAPALGLVRGQAAAAGLVALGLGLVVWISRVRGVKRRERAVLYAASFAVTLLGGVLYSRVVAAPSATPDMLSVRNPIPPDAQSLARGRELYQEQGCVGCHGVAGRGDGPLARNLQPRPADFRAHMAAGHTDGELFNWVTNGVPETAMPAYGGQLSEADRWHVINYVRGFAPQTE